MTSRRRRQNHGEEGSGGVAHGGGALRWMISYSDFMTLLFVVFMVLYSMANVDAAKYHSLAASLRQTMGTSGGAGVDITPLPSGGQAGQATPVIPVEGSGDLPASPDWPLHLMDEETPADETPFTSEPEPEVYTPVPDETAPSAVQTPSVQAPPPDAMSQLAESFQNLPGMSTGLLAATLEERGLTISIAGSILFAPGQATLKPDAKDYLAGVARNLEGVELPILVEGTADRPDGSSSQGYNPWELAALRAAAVVNYFVQDCGFPGSRFVTIGYGSSDGSARPPEVVNIVVLRQAQ